MVVVPENLVRKEPSDFKKKIVFVNLFVNMRYAIGHFKFLIFAFDKPERRFSSFFSLNTLDKKAYQLQRQRYIEKKKMIFRNRYCIS